jgi:RNA-directed DNA polymerase
MNKKRRANLKLSDCWLCGVDSPADLARRLSTPGNKLTVKDLRVLSEDVGNFRLFTLTNDKGKSRAIQWPKRRLQSIHARVHTLLSRVVVPEYLHSAVQGRSYVSNAAAHGSAVPVVKIDVKKFFPSVSRAAVFKFFEGPLRCRRDVAGLLADILTYKAHLPTGGAASPIIAYYSFKKMFDEIDQLARSRDVIMTCYVDDMALSGPRASKGLMREIQQIISKHGLRSHKAHKFSASEPKVITGVCITADGPRVPNKLHLKIKNGFEDLCVAETSSAKVKALGPLIGRMEAAGQIEPAFKARAKTLRDKQLRLFASP